MKYIRCKYKYNTIYFIGAIRSDIDCRILMHSNYSIAASNGTHFILIVLKFSLKCNSIYHSISMHNFVLRGINPTPDHVGDI